MTSQHLELERKYEVDAALAWVDLSGLPGVTGVAAPEVVSLRATYYDTERLDLARAKVTLRRRTGGSDAGWHLKLPAAAGGRVEHGEPLGDDDASVPASLVELTRMWTRGRELRPVATLSTERTVHRLLGD